MLRLSVMYAAASDLDDAMKQEIGKGVLLVKHVPDEPPQFRDPVTLTMQAPGGSIEIVTEVLSVLAGVGIVVAFPPSRIGDVIALAAATPSAPAAAPVRAVEVEETASAQTSKSMADKIQLALHGTREDRAAILRDQNRAVHPYVLKNPQLTIEEVTSWAKNADLAASFLRLLAERREWLTRPAIAEALARNPRTPADLAIKAVEFVPHETLRQMAKGNGAPHVVQAARKKVIGGR